MNENGKTQNLVLVVIINGSVEGSFSKWMLNIEWRIYTKLRWQDTNQIYTNAWLSMFHPESYRLAWTARSRARRNKTRWPYSRPYASPGKTRSRFNPPGRSVLSYRCLFIHLFIYLFSTLITLVSHLIHSCRPVSFSSPAARDSPVCPGARGRCLVVKVCTPPCHQLIGK